MSVDAIVVGDIIHIYEMNGEPRYSGAEGIVTHIDDMGQIHGNWGGCALIPNEDFFCRIGHSDTVSDN